MAVASVGEVGISKLPVQNQQQDEIPSEISSRYESLHRLGEGGFASVKQVVHIQTQMIYALKIVRLPAKRKRRERERCLDEVKIMRRLESYHHIVKVVESYATEKKLFVILDPIADGGDLKKFLAQYQDTIDPTLKLRMESDIQRAYGCLASGLVFLRQNRIRHRDIKPENILIHRGLVMFTDFGASKDYSGVDVSRTESCPGAYTNKYAPPEVKKQEWRHWSAEVFSLGCVFLVMWNATIGRNEVLEYFIEEPMVFRDYLEPIRDELNEDEDGGMVVKAMKEMLRFDAHERIEATSVIDLLKSGGDYFFCERCQGCSWEEPIGQQHEDGGSVLSNSDSRQYDSQTGITHHSLSIKLEDTIPQDVRTGPQEHMHKTSAITLGLDQTHKALTVIPHRTGSMASSNDSQHCDTQHGSAIDELYMIPTPTQALSRRPIFVSADRSIYIPSLLSCLGFHKHKVIRTLRHLNMINGENSNTTRQIYEDHVYDRHFPSFNFGVRLSKRRPFDSILPSLATYPIVPEFDFEYDLLRDGSISEIQQAFDTGKIHPYVQNDLGQNLLHVAIPMYRLDVCALLLHMGVQPTPSHKGRSVFLQAAAYCHITTPSISIDLFRFLIEHLNQTPDFDSHIWQRWSKKFFWHEDLISWLWSNGSELELDPDGLEEVWLKGILRRLQIILALNGHEKAEKLLRFYLPPSIIDKISSNSLTLLDDLFFLIHDNPLSEEATWDLGSLWLKVLADLGVDIPSYILHELDAHPGGLMPSEVYDRKIVGAYTKEKGYMLGWRYAFDHTPGSKLIFEFEALAQEPYDGEWPFAEWDGVMEGLQEREERKMLRFERKIKIKERKALRMNDWLRDGMEVPGSWID